MQAQNSKGIGHEIYNKRHTNTHHAHFQTEFQRPNSTFMKKPRGQTANLRLNSASFLPRRVYYWKIRLRTQKARCKSESSHQNAPLSLKKRPHSRVILRATIDFRVDARNTKNRRKKWNSKSTENPSTPAQIITKHTFSNDFTSGGILTMFNYFLPPNSKRRPY